jgi:hypothetical protein
VLLTRTVDDDLVISVNWLEVDTTLTRQEWRD